MNARLAGLFAGLCVFSSSGAYANGMGDKPPMVLGADRPAFHFVTSDGVKPDWASLRGKVVVMDFWASWCTPCIAAFPKMDDLEKRFKGKPVAFYSVTYETPAMVRPLLNKYPLTTQVSFDDDFATFRSFAAWAIPAVYVFDADGRLAAEVNPKALTPQLIETVLARRRPDAPQQMGWDDPKAAEWYFRLLRQKGEARTGPK